MSYLELFGLSGSGKSTLVRKMAGEKDAVTVHSLDYGKMGILFKPPIGFAFRLMRVLLKHGVPEIGIVKRLVVRYYLYSKWSRFHYISDHGFIQTFLSSHRLMKEARVNPAFVRDFLSILPPGKYGYIPVGVDEAFRREVKRGKFRDWGKDEIRRHLRLQAKAIRQIQECWS